MSLVVVDTDVASTLLRRRTSDVLARHLAGHTIAITFVTYGELTKWTLVRHYIDFAEHEGLELVH